MKRLDLIRHLEKNGCVLLREGGSHSVFKSRYYIQRKSVLIAMRKVVREELAHANAARKAS